MSNNNSVVHKDATRANKAKSKEAPVKDKSSKTGSRRESESDAERTIMDAGIGLALPANEVPLGPGLDLGATSTPILSELGRKN